MPKLIKKPVQLPSANKDPFAIEPDSLFFSDLHLHERKEFSRVDPVTGLNSRLMEGLNILDQIIDICEKHTTINSLIFLGDLFELKDRIPNHVLIEFKKKRRKLLEEAQQLHSIFFLMGNHDYNLLEYPTLDLFLTSHPFEFIKESGIYGSYSKNATGKVVDSNLIAFIPYQRNPEDFEKEWVKAHEAKPQVICFHQEIPGAKYETGKLISGEFRLKLDPNIIYLSGHLHKPQKVHGVQFLGSPYQTRFNDENDERFVWLFNSKTKKLAPLALEYSKFINLDFNKIECQQDLEIAKNNYVRIIGNVYKQDLGVKEKKDLRKRFEDVGAKAVVFATKYINQTQTEIQTDEVRNDEIVIRQYAKKNVGGFDLKRLEKIGVDAYNNVTE